MLPGGALPASANKRAPTAWLPVHVAPPAFSPQPHLPWSTQQRCPCQMCRRVEPLRLTSHIDVTLQVPTTVSPVPEMPASAASQGATPPNTRLVDNLARFPAVKPRSLDWLLKLVDALYKNKATKVPGACHWGSSFSQMRCHSCCNNA